MSELDLSNKSLSKLPEFQPDEYRNTTILDLSNNQLILLPSEIGKFVNLQVLKIAYNKLSFLLSEIGNLKKLVQLDLNDNRLTSLPPEIGNLKVLEYLDLSNNSLASLPPGIGDLEKLVQLDLNNNRLTSLPSSVGKLMNLLTLKLNKNKLSSLPSEIGDLKNLQHFKLNDNELFHIPKEIGMLKRLVTLHLLNNHIEHLPEDIINLEQLCHLSLTDNNLPLPEDADEKNPQSIIEYVLENQPKLPGSRAYIFRNFGMERLIREYGEKLDMVLKQRGIECKNIEKREDLDDEVTVVFIIIPFDINEKSDLTDDITEICEARQIQFHILFHSREHATGDMMNLEKINAVINLRKKLKDKFAGHIISYESFEHLTDLITEGMRQYSPLIRLRSLRLTNIGHFSDLAITMDDHVTCLEGENGTGKTTILRALALGIIGSDHSKIDREKIKSLLSVKRLDTDGNIKFENGKIELDYIVDGDKFTHIIELNSVDNGRDVEIADTGDFHILSGRYNLKSLIMGFPQSRGEMDSKTASEVVFRGLTSPHVDDLIPLINNRDEHHVQSFSAWITNLDNTANQKEKRHPESDPGERKIIREVFEIITHVTDHPIAFKTVRQASPPDIWVTTKDAPNGISLNLLSQGFKVIMGWVGYFVQRMVQSYAFSKDFTKENAVVLIDEIDSYLHPKWQARLLQVLREHFPGTQFVISSHSPLILGSLKTENIYLLEFDGDNVSCYQPPFNPYGADTNRILDHLMGQSERAIEKVAELLKEYSDFADSGELDRAKRVGEEIRQLIDPEDPEILKTDVLIQAKEFLRT